MNLEDDAEGDGAWNKSSSESDDQSFEGEEISTQTETTKPLKQLKEKKVQVVPKQIKWYILLEVGRTLTNCSIEKRSTKG